MLIVATPLSTLILYLWTVLIWQRYNQLCLSEMCLQWQRRSKVPPNAPMQWLLLGFRSVVKTPCFISSHKGVLKLISFLCVVREKFQRGTHPFCFAIVNILGTKCVHNFLCPNFSVTVSWIVVLHTSGMMWCNSQSPAFGFGSTLPFQTRLTHTKPVLPLSNEHGWQVKDQGQQQCCHNKHKKFPYQPTRDESLLSWHAS
jgi:hypothetical protein